MTEPPTYTTTFEDAHCKPSKYISYVVVTFIWGYRMGLQSFVGVSGIGLRPDPALSA